MNRENVRFQTNEERDSKHRTTVSSQTRRPGETNCHPSVVPSVVENRRDGRSSSVSSATARRTNTTTRANRSTASCSLRSKASSSLVRGSDDSVVDVKSYPIVDVVGGAYIGKEARLVKRTKERV